MNGTEYEFRVRAANSESGWGEWATVYATPEAPGAITVPGAPQELEATPKDTAVRRIRLARPGTVSPMKM